MDSADMEPELAAIPESPKSSDSGGEMVWSKKI